MKIVSGICYICGVASQEKYLTVYTLINSLISENGDKKLGI